MVASHGNSISSPDFRGAGKDGSQSEEKNKPIIIVDLPVNDSTAFGQLFLIPIEV